MMACIWFFLCDYNILWTPPITWVHPFEEFEGLYYEEYPIS